MSNDCFGGLGVLLMRGGLVVLDGLVEVDRRGENGLVRGVEVLLIGVFIGLVSSSIMIGDGGEVSIVRSTSIDVNKVEEVDLNFFNGFGEKVTFFLEVECRVSEEYE